MTDVFTLLPPFRQLSARLEGLEGPDSAFLLGPRHYGKRQILQCLARDVARSKSCRSVVLSPISAITAGVIDYSALWRMMHFDAQRRRKIATALDFQDALYSAISRVGQRLVLFVNGPGRTNETPYIELLASLDHVLSAARTNRKSLSIVATDDYSLFFYRTRASLESAWAFLGEPVQYLPLTEEDILACFRAGVPQAPTTASGLDVAGLATRLRDDTGGHPGLVIEALHRLASASPQDVHERGRDGLPSLLKSSHILARLARAIDEDRAALVATSLRFVDPENPSSSDPRILFLRELGVLQTVSPTRVQLCPGAITTLVGLLRSSDSADSPQPSPHGANGGVAFTPDTGLTDDDFVILHLSDIHVGTESYRFRLQIGQRFINESEPTLEKLIADDVASLGLLGRVDAVVLSGDYVWNGQRMDEFLAAERVIAGLVTKLQVPPERVLMIPGNHDVGWDPTDLQPATANAEATRANYDAFLRLLRRDHEGTVARVSVVSRSERAEMRIAGLESNRVEGRSGAGIGYVSLPSLEAAQSYFEEESADGPANIVGWLVVHHHLFPATSASVQDASSRKVSVMANAAQILTLASQWGVEAMLHGHEHQPLITVAHRWPQEVGPQLSPILALGVGSCSAKQHLGPIGRNHYYIIYRRKQDILVRSRWLGDSATMFTRHDDVPVVGCSRLLRRSGRV